jgi:DNA polymerase-3 subunit gamma/tau
MTSEEYRVLARKYRPTNFDDLIGQEVLVRTLSNAISSGRIAHAFLLTGIRGIGKTTTARIIARALNCVGPDGNGRPTVTPCGVCPSCKAIDEDKHMDVIEMDAASRTGVNDIREIIDTVHYAPNSARYKIYIIDEVHMLSNNAFNALLKTLEEPPAHVKFIFATTEIRKIPVTILSRCQCFDLKRVDIDTLSQHLKNIATKESVEIEDNALSLISAAAEGSVRDALSLLDQAIAHASLEGDHTAISEQHIRDMLGMSDKSSLFNVIESLFEGNVSDVLGQVNALYHEGSDPLTLLQDTQEMVHFISRIKLAPKLNESIHYSEVEKTRGAELAAKLNISLLSRTWQMLSKGIQEVKFAMNPLTATEMVMIRIAHMAMLPPPGDLVKQLKEKKTHNVAASTPIAAPSPPPAPISGNLALATQQSIPEVAPVVQQEAHIDISDFKHLVALFETNKEMVLYSYLYHDSRLVSFAPGKLELNVASQVPQDFAGNVARKLQEWTGERWMIALSKSVGEATLEEHAKAEQAAQIHAIKEDPNIKAALDLFPGARVVSVNKPTPSGDNT